MGRCILVLAPHRSGSSAVAGALHHLGVHMGDRLIGPGVGNPKGHFEDLDFVLLHDKIIGNWQDPNTTYISDEDREALRALVEQKEQKTLWGIKDPRMCITVKWLADFLQEPRVVCIERDFNAMVRSLMYRSNMSRARAARLQRLLLEERERFLKTFRGPVMRLHYESLVEEPRYWVEELAAFAFEGLDLEPNVEAAVEFVDPSLRHF